MNAWARAWKSKPVRCQPGFATPLLSPERSSAQLKIFTARETTTATVTNDARDCSIINNFAQAVSGIVSVGLKAVAFVNEV